MFEVKGLSLDFHQSVLEGGWINVYRGPDGGFFFEKFYFMVEFPTLSMAPSSSLVRTSASQAENTGSNPVGAKFRYKI